MFGTGSRACSSYPRAQAGWASSAWWHRCFSGIPGSCKAMFPLQAADSHGRSNENTGSKQKRNGLGLMDYFPSLAAGKTGRGQWSFCPQCKFPVTVKALKQVPVQCEGDPAEGSAGQDIWPSHSAEKPSGQNFQSHPSANQRFFTTSIITPQTNKPIHLSGLQLAKGEL